MLLIIGNFAVDSVVLLLGLAILQVQEAKTVWRNSVFRIVYFGFLSDLLGSLASTVLAYTGLFPYIP